MSLVQQEYEKYRKAYSSGAYPHSDSIGYRVAPIAWGWMVGLGCERVMDWGCGHGRAMRWFRGQGVEASGIDLVPCVNTKADPDFYAGTIWDPPGMPLSDFAFSSDVFEHLPEEKVADAIEHMRRLTLEGGWVQIATIPDQRGQEIGETLHLTVKPPGWWRAEFSRHWEIAGMQTTEREVRLWLKA